jgi:hypothetical protein
LDKMFYFCLLTVAERVCRHKPHTLAGAALGVVMLEAPLDDVPVYAIQVTGNLKELSQELISMFFESQKRSGGGQIDEIMVNHRNGVAVITFESAEGNVPHLLHNISHFDMHEIKLHLSFHSQADP